ncbi:transcriptional protein SWT1 [Tachyglossus aculeatus]|uniref:transcriptional protein SWT1 n=1 Tax=Tachyglossus aculeatus TaxID=9261 RepID=UPI0018F3FE64|nr:transcriptional protein SWT1 [Tachyglossus aculeatus]
MSKKESIRKHGKSCRDVIYSAHQLAERDKKGKKPVPAQSSAYSSSKAEKRKLESDPTDILHRDTKGKVFKRSEPQLSISKKRKIISSVPQDLHELQKEFPVCSHQVDASLTQSKKGIETRIVIKSKSVKLTKSKDLSLDSSSRRKFDKDLLSEAGVPTSERKWPFILVQNEKKKRKKLEKAPNKNKHDAVKYKPEKCKVDEFVKESVQVEIESMVGCKREKISFHISKKTHKVLRKPEDKNVFSTKSHKTEISYKNKNSRAPSNLPRHKVNYLLDSSHGKRTDHRRKEVHYPEQPIQTTNCTRTEETLSNETNLAKTCDVSPSTSSLSRIQDTDDTDQEMQIVEELHAARAGKSVDLPDVPTSKDLTSMEIDLEDEDMRPSIGNTASETKLLIVIDTNILMNHLQFVRILKSTEVPGFDKLVLVIPWIVIQELDRMKDGKLLKHAQHKAIPAVYFINDCLKLQDGKLWGQSLQLASQKLYGMSDENNDDRVLKCCLQYQNLFPKSVVLLCTDDRNLCNKGMISGVKSLNKGELITELQNLNAEQAVPSHYPCISPQESTVAGPQEKTQKDNTPRSGKAMLLERFITDLEKCLGTALSSILETEMKFAFGNLWMEVLYLKPPWTLAQLLKCFKKHWLAVFGLIMKKEFLVTIEDLYERLCKAKAVDFATVKSLLQSSKDLLHAFSTRSNYDGILPQAFAQVNALLQSILKIKSELKPNSSEEPGALSENAACNKQEGTSLPQPSNQEDKSLAFSQLPQSSRHQEIWSILESVWRIIYENSTNVFQILDSTTAQTTPMVTSFEEAYVCLQKLIAAMKNILTGFQRILAPNSSCQDVDTLYNFLISSEINKSITFTAQDLYECVSQANYREKLTIGYSQLAHLEYTMQQINASVYMEAKRRGWCEHTHSDRT